METSGDNFAARKFFLPPATAREQKPHRLFLQFLADKLPQVAGDERERERGTPGDPIMAIKARMKAEIIRRGSIPPARSASREPEALNRNSLSPPHILSLSLYLADRMLRRRGAGPGV